MRGVTFEELSKWLKKNDHHTWNFDNKTLKKVIKSTLKIKYLEFSIDTRDMHIWSINISGMGEEFFIRDDNKDDGRTILDAAQDWLGEK